MRRIKLTMGFFALVDAEDFERINAHKWYASIESRGTKIYAKRGRKKSDDPARWKAAKIRMSHAVLDKSPSELAEGHIIDHDDHDGLNNCKHNLFERTQVENMKRSEGWKKKIAEPCL